MDIPQANVETRILDRRVIPGDVPDAVDSGRTGRRSDLYKVTDEHNTVVINIYIEELVHSKLMTVKQNTQDKNGRIYIEELHTTLPSDLRPGDELVKLDNVVFTETTTESIQKHFSFDADSNGRRAKTVTIRRPQTEDGETEEIDVEVAIVSKMINAEHASRIQTRFVLPRRRQRLGPRHQARKVQWVQLKRERADKVFIRTSNRKFLTVRNGAIVGEEMGEDNKRDFLFDLVPGTAAYSSKYSRLRTKVVICCKLRWNSYWLKTSMGSDGEFEMELTENDTDDHTTVFKRRVKSDGRYGTGFECLLFKNVYIQYYPSRNEVDVKPYNPRINIGVTLKAVPVSTLFHVVKQEVMVGLTRDSHSTDETSPRFRANIDRFEDEETTSCCFGCFGLFRKRSSRSDESGSLDSEPTFPSNNTSSRMGTDDGAT